MRLYFLFVGKFIASIVIALMLALINMYIYATWFGGFEFPIIDFCFIVVPVWFILITSLIFLLKKHIPSFNTTSIDLAIITCSIYGIFGFSDLQLNQKRIVFERANERSEDFKETLIQKKDRFLINVSELKAGLADNYNGINADFYLYHALKLDSLVNSKVDGHNYKKELICNECFNEVFYTNLTRSIDQYMDSLDETKKAKNEYEKERDNEIKKFYIMFYLSALILGIIKVSLEFIKKSKTQPKTLRFMNRETEGDDLSRI